MRGERVRDDDGLVLGVEVMLKGIDNRQMNCGCGFVGGRN